MPHGLQKGAALLEGPVDCDAVAVVVRTGAGVLSQPEHRDQREQKDRQQQPGPEAGKPLVHGKDLLSFLSSGSPDFLQKEAGKIILGNLPFDKIMLS